jgi:hypothetical protein
MAGAVGPGQRRCVAAPVVAILLLLIVPAATAPALPDERGLPRPRRDGEPLSRVGELLEWLAREQQADGGWNFRGRLPLGGHLHARPEPQQTVDSTVLDTAIAALAMVRAGMTLERGHYREYVRNAADYLYREVHRSGNGAAVESLPTPLGVRIGPHVDSFLALLFFLEVSSPEGGGNYAAAAEILIRKIERNQRPDGSWGEVWDPDVGHAGAGHAPLIGHALGVWALESAVRHGWEVDRDAVARAEAYAMSEDAEKREWKTNDTWRQFRRRLEKVNRAPPRWCKEKWLEAEGVEDDEPVNHELYVMAARLSVLHQADLTNRWLLSRPGPKVTARTPIRELERLRDMRAAAERTRAALEAGRQSMREGWIKVHKRDRDPSPAPLFFTGEDFLASLLVVDAMGRSEGVEEWFLPTARRLMVFQTMDGGLLTDVHVRCHPRKCNSFHDSPYLCDLQLSWCSRDRVFMTAAALSMLTADTPYRPTVLGQAGTGGKSR